MVYFGAKIKFIQDVDVNLNGIKFKSSSGNEYFYDNNSGQIFNLCNQTAEYISKIKNVSSDDVSTCLIKKGKGFRQMILQLTNQCNFRCRYCTYSDCYEYTDGYSDNYMTFETAKKAIDLYIENYNKVYMKNPLVDAFIGFYGGEPLLNYDVIKNCIEYIKQKYCDVTVKYNITTNAFILTEEMIDFFIENDFSISISLDGNKFDHDRNRLTVNDEATFDIVMRNIDKIRKKYPDYKKISISACYDFKSDLIRTKKFFETEKLSITNFSPIEIVNTTYYKQFTQDDINLFNEKLSLLEKEMLEHASKNELAIDKFVYSALSVPYLELSFHCMMGDLKNPLIPYTGACIPGEKLFVTPNGEIHMCEKINSNYKIGSLDDGLDFNLIANILNEYNNKIGSNCINCKVNKLCNNCFYKFSGDGSFNYNNELCLQFIKSCKITL